MHGSTIMPRQQHHAIPHRKVSRTNSDIRRFAAVADDAILYFPQAVIIGCVNAITKPHHILEGKAEITFMNVLPPIAAPAEYMAVLCANIDVAIRPAAN